MATTESGEFERALARLEQIVTKLDGEEIELDVSVELFKEGKLLARRCETLLKAAQEAVERAALAEAAEPDARTARAPAKPTPSGLFDEAIDDDGVPF